MAKCVQCGRSLPPFSIRKVCQWCRGYEAARNAPETDADVRQPVMQKPWERAGSNTPYVTLSIFAINSAVFLGMALSGVSFTDPNIGQLLQWGANWGPRTLGPEWWRLITSMFVHGGIIHLAFNMWCLWDLGNLAEHLYGRATFLALYFAAGIGGSLASMAWHPQTVSVGASGAIFGIAGALIASFKLGEFNLPSAAIHATYRSVLAFAGYNLVFGAISRRTDNACHIGGLVVGLIFGALVARLAPYPDRPGPRLALVGVMALLLVAGASGVVRLRGYAVHMFRAHQLLQQNQIDAAIAEAEIAVRSRSRDAKGHAMLARMYFVRSRNVEAEREFKRALELNPGDAETNYELGSLYFAANRLEEAKAQLRAAAERDPRADSPHLRLGMVLAVEGKHQDAVAEYRKAAELNPESALAYFQMGMSYSSLKQPQQAIAAFQKAVELAPNDSGSVYQLARAYDANGMPREAADAYRKAEALKNAEAKPDERQN